MAALEAQDKAEASAVESPPSTEGAPEGQPDPDALATDKAAAPPDPEHDKIRKARQAAEERTASFQRERDRLAADYRSKQEAKRARDELEQHRASVAQDLELAKLARENPFEYLRRIGKSADELVAEGLKQGSPEAKHAAQLAEMQRRLDEMDRRNAELEQRSKVSARDDAVQRYESQFRSLVQAQPESFPTLAEYEPDYVHFRARNVAIQYYRETGEYAPPENILYFLESELHKERQARRGKARTQGGAGEDPGASDANSTGGPIETLNGAHVPGPTRPSAQLSEQERRKLAMAQIDRLQRG